jgi:hypothetical protein
MTSPSTDAVPSQQGEAASRPFVTERRSTRPWGQLLFTRLVMIIEGDPAHRRRHTQQ